MANQNDSCAIDLQANELIAGGQVARKVRAREVQASAGPEVCDSWDWVAEGFLRDVVRHLDLPSVTHFRLTCKRWRIIADRSVEVRPDPHDSACMTHTFGLGVRWLDSGLTAASLGLLASSGSWLPADCRQ